VLDYDMYDDLSYGKDLAELHVINFSEYLDLNIHETFMNYLTRYSKHIEIENTKFSLYSYDANVKKRPIAIYLLIEDNECVFMTKSYEECMDILRYNLDLNHNIVAIAEFTSLEECEEVYDKISAPKILKTNK
jgi:hypothetical protein